MSVVAIIPARGGSKGLPGKNLKMLGGIPLVARAILAARAASRVEQVYVSSDDREILNIAEQWGAAPIRRPQELSGDTASSEQALLHALDEIERRSDAPDITVFLQCTSPFTTSDDIDQVIAALDDRRTGSAFSAMPDHGFLWRADKHGFAQGINHDHQKPRQRRQDLNPQLRETGAVYAMKTNAFRKAESRFCGRSRAVETMSNPLEIDSPRDWWAAQALLGVCAVTPVFKARASAIKTIVTDFDGVHTDDRVYVDQAGTEMVVCSRGDGLAIELLRASGFQTLILSKETNPVVARRAEKLAMPVIQGIDDKQSVLSAWLAERDIGWGEIAYIGNDVNDVACIEQAGLGFAPADAHLRARIAADIVLQACGGAGALREMADMFLEQQP